MKFTSHPTNDPRVFDATAETKTGLVLSVTGAPWRTVDIGASTEGSGVYIRMNPTEARALAAQLVACCNAVGGEQ